MTFMHNTTTHYCLHDLRLEAGSRESFNSKISRRIHSCFSCRQEITNCGLSRFVNSASGKTLVGFNDLGRESEKPSSGLVDNDKVITLYLFLQGKNIKQVLVP